MKPCRHLLTTPTRDSFSGPLYNCTRYRCMVTRCKPSCPKYAAAKDAAPKQGGLW